MAYERKFKVTSSLQGAYKLHKEKNSKITREVYFAVVYDITKAIADMIIRESFEYRIPEKLGFLRIRKKKPKLKIRDGRIDINKNIIDWEATWKYWETTYSGKTRKEIRGIKNKPGVIFQTNPHTDGEVMSWYWDKMTCTVKNNSVYNFSKVKGGIFDGLHTGRLGLAWWIKSDEKMNDYYY
jgi:hypothetical protein